MIGIIPLILINLFRVYLILKFWETFLGERTGSLGKFLTICMITIINEGCNIVAGTLFMGWFRQLYAVFLMFLILICERLAGKVVSNRKNSGNMRNFFLALVLLCSVGLFVLQFFIRSSTKRRFAIACLGFLVINFMIFCLYHILSEMLSEKYENEILRQEVQNYLSQLEIMRQGEEKIKALRHDMKHHMNELKLMAERNKNREIEKYIDDMENFMVNPDEIVSSGNLEIDSVLNFMLSKAKKELKTVNVNVKIPENTGHSFDVNVILGNLLENAIEAAGQTEEKMLNVNIQFRQEVLRIQIENSYCGVLKADGDKLLTTKSDQTNHGIGLKNVKRMVEKYNGLMEMYPKEHTFCVRLILYMTAGQE